jgi:restriction modification system DNA specificity domain protein
LKAILPKIKFKNFNEKWNRKKLQSIAPLRGGFAFKSEKFLDSGIPIVRISNIKFDGTVGGEFEYYSKINPDEKFVLRGRSILLAMSGATTGKIAMLDSEKEYYQNQRVGYFQNTGAVDYDFLSSILQTKEFTNQLNSVLVAGAQPNISSKEVDSFVFCIPESLDEQSAIGILFRTLDDLLASYKDNLANYQSLKATMLSKMFPKAGQTVPEIRLDGFEGEWKFSSLGEQADITKLAGFEFTNHVVYSDEGEIPAIRGLNVKNQKVNLSDVKYIDKSDFSKLDRSKLIEDDLLFTYVGTVGEVARVPESVLWYLAPNVSRIRLNRALDSRFVLYQMASNRFKQKQIFPLIATSSQPALSMANIRKFIISFTTLEEQQAIGSYFSNLDNLISAHQEKISQLETLKKKLLQDMFI